MFFIVEYFSQILIKSIQLIDCFRSIDNDSINSMIDHETTIVKTSMVGLKKKSHSRNFNVSKTTAIIVQRTQ